VPPSIEELRARIQRVVDEAKLPGGGFAVVRSGEIAYAGGVGNQAWRSFRPRSASALFSAR